MAPPNAVVLPRLDLHGIPRTYEVGSPERDITVFAEAFALTSILQKRHWSEGKLQTTCCKAFDEWIAGHYKDTLDLSITFTSVIDDPFNPEDVVNNCSERYKAQLSNPTALGAFYIHPQSPFGHPIGAKLEWLEKQQPGLGQHILRLIDELHCKSQPCFTPAWALHEAKDMYWYGEDDERTALLENGGESEGVVSLRDFKGDIPEWAFTARGPVEHSLIRNAAKTIKWPALFEPALKAQGLRTPEYHFHFFENTSAYCVPLVLHWRGDKQDGITRVFDDCYNHEMEIGDRVMDTCWIHCFNATKPASIVAALTNLSILLYNLNLLVAILSQLGEEENKEKLRIRV